MRTYARLTWRIPGVGGLRADLRGGAAALALLNGFPFLFPDSWGYSGACPDEMRSPVLGCAMRPFTWLAGHWAYALVQCAVTAFAVVLLWSRALKRRGPARVGGGAAPVGGRPVRGLGHGGRVDADRPDRALRGPGRVSPGRGRAGGLCLGHALRQLSRPGRHRRRDAALGARPGALRDPARACAWPGRSSSSSRPTSSAATLKFSSGQRVRLSRRARAARRPGGARPQRAPSPRTSCCAVGRRRCAAGAPRTTSRSPGPAPSISGFPGRTTTARAGS